MEQKIECHLEIAQAGRRAPSTWWRHQMETFSALLAICAGNLPVTSEVPAQRPVARSFDVSFDLRLNKPLSKQCWGWWFETLSRPLWGQRNEVYSTVLMMIFNLQFTTIALRIYYFEETINLFSIMILLSRCDLKQYKNKPEFDLRYILGKTKRGVTELHFKWH